jgi:hypothetical protein
MADDDRKARMARRGSSMLTAITKSAVKLTDMAGRAKKVVEEKRRRAEFALIASTSEKWNWITDDKEGFVPAKVLKENPDGSMEVEFGVSRSVKTVKKTELGPPIVRLAEIKNHVDGEKRGQAAGDMPRVCLREVHWPNAAPPPGPARGSRLTGAVDAGAVLARAHRGAGSRAERWKSG